MMWEHVIKVVKWKEFAEALITCVLQTCMKARAVEKWKPVLIKMLKFPFWSIRNRLTFFFYSQFLNFKNIKNIIEIVIESFHLPNPTFNLRRERMAWVGDLTFFLRIFHQKLFFQIKSHFYQRNFPLNYFDQF